MEPKKKCEYGAECYRKNPKHLKEYFHPQLQSKIKNVRSSPAKRARMGTSPKKLKQTKLDFHRQVKPLDVYVGTPKKREENSESANKNAKNFKDVSSTSSKNKRIIEESSEEETDVDTSEFCDVTSNSWTFKTSCETSLRSRSATPDSSTEKETECKTPVEKIKRLFLVDMPDDFYSFHEFCVSINKVKPKEALEAFGLRLVGPFDVLTEDLSPGDITSGEALCHWRFYMDPPEMQTVLLAERGLHYGYWRDEPTCKEPFIVSNKVPDCTINSVAANLFGTTVIHLEGYLRRCNPFEKVKATKVLASLKQWAEERGIDLSDCNNSMRERKKKVVASTFHGLGIVVPVDKKTDVGYRPLLESNGNLKKICKGIIKAKTTAEIDSKMEAIERLVNAANIANDEGDFGNALELGIDLFCMGSEHFHDFTEHLLATAYSLLKRPAWAKVISAHLNMRRTDLELSSIKKERNK